MATQISPYVKWSYLRVFINESSSLSVIREQMEGGVTNRRFIQLIGGKAPSYPVTQRNDPEDLTLQGFNSVNMFRIYKYPNCVTRSYAHVACKLR
jgi:hypothetical protein